MRKFSGIGQFTYIEDGAGRLTTRVLDGEFGIEFQNSDRFQLGLNEDYELITRPFSIAPGALIPVGGYGFTTGRMGYTLGQQRPFSGTILVRTRFLLRRRAHRDHVQPSPPQLLSAAVGRADRVVQLARPVCRLVHHEAR